MRKYRALLRDTPLTHECECHKCEDCHIEYEHHWTDWKTKIECPYCQEQQERELLEAENKKFQGTAS